MSDTNIMNDPFYPDSQRGIVQGPTIMKLLSKIKNNCLIQKEMHTESTHYCNRMELILTVVLVLVSLVFSIILPILEYYTTCDTSLILVTIAPVIISGLSVVFNGLGYPKKHQRHKDTAHEYQHISDMVEHAMCCINENVYYENSVHEVKYILSQIQNFKKHTDKSKPSIPKHILVKMDMHPRSL